MEAARPGQGPERRSSEIPTPHQIFTVAQERLLPTETEARKKAQERRQKSDAHKLIEPITVRTPQGRTESRRYLLSDYYSSWSTAFDVFTEGQAYINEQERLLNERRSVLELSIIDERGYETPDMPTYLMFLPDELRDEKLGEDGLNIAILASYPKDQPVIARTRVSTDDPGQYIVLENPGEDEIVQEVYKQWQEPKVS